jgi:mRNA-degrading endonuclease RelE of RelBE toxin-antitoxin system
MWALRFARDVEKDLKKMPARDRRIVLDTIEVKLTSEPAIATRNRKLLMNLVPPWVAEPPIWELRVGKYRVFYDVSEEERTVYICAVREKSRGKTTEEVL